MIKPLTRKIQKDLVKTVNGCVDHTLEAGEQFRDRHNLHQNLDVSVPLSVAFTLLNGIIQAAPDEDARNDVRAVIMGNLEQMFLNVKCEKPMIH